jgi:hypothetical protein
MSNSFQTARRPLEVATIAELGRNIVARGLPGITDEEIERTKELARRIVDYENEMELQLHK